jgi:hypothetical protein
MSWDLTFNANTNSTADLLDTTDDQPISLKPRSTKTLVRGSIMRGSLVCSFILVFAIAVTQAQTQPCSARPGYPKGRWGIRDKNATAASSTFITFTRSDGGTWLPAKGQGTFEATPSPSPDAEVVIKLHVDYGNYESTNNLVVSSDGCRMTGTYSDSEGHRGEASYYYQGVR